jgi:hypothetical protein
MRGAWAQLSRIVFAAGILWSCAGAHAQGDAGAITGKPLAPRPFPRGKTMFVKLSPDDTGVRAQNPYDDPRMWGDLYQEFEVGSIGSGVAIGDYDGDGRPDIFVVNKTGKCQLFRNLGGYKFEDVTDKAGITGTEGAWNGGATFVDINNDGLLDIYLCRFNAPNLLFINQGDGTFKEMAHAYGLDVVDASVQASFCDYDRDGWLDVFIVTNLLDIARNPYGEKDYLFHNNRNGTFTDVTARVGISGVAQGHSATWWDYDNDGWPDLYVANDFGTPDKLYRNNRDGTFTDVIDSVVPHTSFSSMGSDTGDVMNDGRIDLLVADMARTTHQEDQRTEASSRSKTRDVPDGSPTAPKYQFSALFINTGTGRCLEAAKLAGIAATDWTWSVRFEDLDNDGRQDLFVTNGMNREQNNVDILNRQMSAETTAERARIMHDSPVLASTHLAFRNMGDLRFESVGAKWGLDQRGVSFGAATGDLSGDGNLDIVYSNYQGGVTILRNDCDSGHVVNVDLRGSASNRYGVGSVVRVESDLGVQVRQLWLAHGYMSSSEPMLHFGLGKDTLIRRMTVTWPSGRVQVFENLAVDMRYTVTEPPAGAAPPQAAVAPRHQFEEVGGAAGLALASREEIVDETNEQRLIPVRLNRRGPALAVGDVYGEGRDDVVVGGTTLDPLRILRQGPDGRFAAGDASAIAAPNGADDGPVLLFDATGNGTTDLLVTKGGNALPADAPEYQPRLYLNDGHGGFKPAPDGTLPPLPVSAGAVAAADFLHEGRLGLFIGGRVQNGQYPMAPRSALLANRGGRFEDVTDALAPGLRNVGMVTSALWTDVDGDGWPDLLVALEWGCVRYFHNNAGKGFEDWTERAGFAEAGTGWWTSIAAADLGGSGRMDYIVGNVGLNTQYRADTQHPALLYSGDFRGNGASELIEAYYEGDAVYPWRTRRDLDAVIPSILRKYPRNDLYARATLQEILGADRLAAASRFAATQFQSGVFRGQPDGTFRFEPLPRIAQVAPLQGMVAGDLLGDGRADVYAVQNSFAPIPPVGRFDGGLSQLLRGDGRGRLDPVAPAESNLVVPGDAKALVILDVGGAGWPSLAVTRNGSASLLFRNGGAPGRRPLKVVLRGGAGNPTAVGARVMAAFADGSSQTCEVHAGSGYYSQSTASCFFGYSESNPAISVSVRWPSGAVSASAVRRDDAVLALSPPPAGARP